MVPIEVLDKIAIQKDVIESVIKNNEYNKKIIEYYWRYVMELKAQHYNYHTIVNKINCLKVCNKFWAIDKYELHKIKDVKSQNLCHDKFCANCKMVRQSARMAKYITELEKYKESLYHLVLTIPNCSGSELNKTIKHMAKCYKALTNYLTGHNKIAGVNFSRLGYLGAVRSLEVPFKGDNYHPHFHVGIVLNKDVLGRKIITNTYSYNYKNGFPELKRLFCEEEILIQKIWYLLLNEIKVTKANIDKLEKGYSCTLDKFQPGDYAELFKYMTKEKDQAGKVLTYENFKTLYEQLYRVKQIQGYGCLYRIKDNIDLEEYEQQWTEFINGLKNKETPALVTETPQELLEDKAYKIIGRKSYYKHLRELYQEQQKTTTKEEK